MPPNAVSIKGPVSVIVKKQRTSPGTMTNEDVLMRDIRRLKSQLAAARNVIADSAVQAMFLNKDTNMTTERTMTTNMQTLESLEREIANARVKSQRGQQARIRQVALQRELDANESLVKAVRTRARNAILGIQQRLQNVLQNIRRKYASAPNPIARSAMETEAVLARRRAALSVETISGRADAAIANFEATQAILADRLNALLSEVVVGRNAEQERLATEAERDRLRQEQQQRKMLLDPIPIPPAKKTQRRKK
jgi:hypothetical protein